VSKEAGIGALAEGNAVIVAELMGDLAVAGVDGKDAGRPTLEHAVGETSGGSSDIDAGQTSKIDRPVGQGMFKLETTATDILEIGAEEANRGSLDNGGAGLVDALLVDKNPPSKDEGLGALTGGGVALVYEEFVEADLHER
jgi:hypothetical protein